MATGIIGVLLIFLATLVAALLLEPFAKRLRLPYPALLVLVGFLGSEWLVASGIDTGLRWDSFRDLVFFVLLPLIIFEAALRIDAEALLHDLPITLLLALPLMLVAMWITALLLFWGVGHPQGFPWVAALLAGTLLAATDPGAVLTYLRQIPQLGRMGNLLQGESLFNDALAVVLFAVFVAMAADPARTPDLATAAVNVMVIFSGGALMGGGLGLLALGLWRWLKGVPQRAALSLACALGGYWLAEAVFKVSGVMVVLVAGLMFNAKLRGGDQAARGALADIWSYKAFVADALLFVLLGVTFRWELLADQWLAALLGIGAAVLARALIVYGGLWLAARIRVVAPVSALYKSVVFMGGIRGATTVALTLSLPAGLSYDHTVQAIVYGVVVFTLVAQAPLTVWIANRGTT